MYLTSNNANFRLVLPDSIIEPAVMEYYNQYLHDEDFPHNTISDLINHNIQAIILPGLNIPITSPRSMKSGTSIQELFGKDLSITIKHMSGNITLLPLLESAEKYFKSSGKENLHIGNLDIFMTDDDGNYLFSITYYDCLYTEVPYPSISFTDGGSRGETFDLNLTWNEMGVKILPEL